MDSSNKTIAIDKPAERIIPIVAWTYEPLYIQGAQDKIAGVEEGSHSHYSWLPGIEEKPITGTNKGIQIHPAASQLAIYEGPKTALLYRFGAKNALALAES